MAGALPERGPEARRPREALVARGVVRARRSLERRRRPGPAARDSA